MLPIVVVCLAILFLLATYSGLLEDFAAMMQKLWGEPADREQTLLPLSRQDESFRDRSESPLQSLDLANGSVENADEDAKS